MPNKRYALVGTGSRATMFIDALITKYRDVADLVAFCDLSQVRMDWYNRRLLSLANLSPLPTYRAEQFDRMIAEARPDTVIVTTMDATHHVYIVRAMELRHPSAPGDPGTPSGTAMRCNPEFQRS